MDDWQDISTAPCNDTLAMVRWKDGGEAITDLDHDSDPAWWAERGATQWRMPTEAELEAYHDRVNRIDPNRGRFGDAG